MNPETDYYESGQVWTETWRNDSGELHRLDGPAWRVWRENGQLYYEEWYINGIYHRLDGLARQYWNNTGHLNCAEYWINGVKYSTEAEFQVAVDLYKANEIADLF